MIKKQIAKLLTIGFWILEIVLSFHWRVQNQ